MDNLPTHSSLASLVLISPWFIRLGLWAMLEQQVCIPQKTVRHTPTAKLLDAWLVMLAGGAGVVEANTRVRPDQALLGVFGRASCAEQSTISRTLSACTPTTVAQLRACLTHGLRQHGQAYAHDFQAREQLLDIDLTGLVAGRQAEGATKGYFAGQRSRRGRQLGRVLATHYAEVLVDQLYEGKRQLEHSFQPLVQAAEAVLDLTETRRKRTILRLDGGGGSDANLNWALTRGYQVVAKVHNWQRARRLAQSVTDWQPDPKLPQRQVGWVIDPMPYAAPTRQVAIRYPNPRPKAGEPWRYHVLVTNVDEPTLATLGGWAAAPPSGRWAVLYAYDLRDGGIETQTRSDKQGLGLARRNKRAFAAQEVLVLLAQLAHNVVIWVRNHLAHSAPRFADFGVARMVRDVFHIDGTLTWSSTGQLQSVALNPRHPYAAAVQQAFRQ
jgi:hypothetical protein